MTLPTPPSTVPFWATATGTEITTLTLTAVEYIGDYVAGDVVYSLLEYTASGDPDFTALGVLSGHWLTASGFSNSINNNTSIIHAVNNTTKKLTIRLVGATADTNETGVGGSGTVNDAGAVLVKPSDSKLAQGLINGEKPGAGHLNWLFWSITSWVNHFYSIIDLDYFVGRRLTAGANVTLTDNGDNTERIDVEISDTPFSVEAHGFTLGQAIRWNESAWVLAQGDSEANATDVWLVTGVPDVDHFFAYRTEQRTATAHGLGTAGQTLYLSATTAGALTATRPDSDYYLPVCTVVDTNTLDIAIELTPRYERRRLVIASGSGTIPNTGSPDYLTINTAMDLSQKANRKLRLTGRVSAPTSGTYFQITNISYTGRSGRQVGKQWSTGTSAATLASISTTSDSEIRIYPNGITSNMFTGDHVFYVDIIYDPTTATLRIVQKTLGSTGDVYAIVEYTGVSFPSTPVFNRLYGDNFEPYQFVLERD